MYAQREVGVAPWTTDRFPFASVLTSAQAASFERPAVRWDALNDVGNLGRAAAVDVSPFDWRTIVAGGDVLGAGVTHDGGVTWEHTFGFLNYQDNDITFHPKDRDTRRAVREHGGR